MVPALVRRGPFPVVFRRLEVLSTRQLTRHYVRVTVGGEELRGFRSEGADDHVKLLFPPPERNVLDVPQAGPNGLLGFTPEQRARLRDFTPRRFDPERLELDLDFALHDTGVASHWARQAKPGSVLGVGGPRGSLVVPYEFDWYLLAGDESALPAIARRLEELPAEARVQVLIEVDGAEDEQPLETRARAEVRWLQRTGTSGSALERAVRELGPFEGSGFGFVAGESSAVAAIRNYLVAERAWPREHLRISGYWKRGVADFQEHG